MRPGRKSPPPPPTATWRPPTSSATATLRDQNFISGAELERRETTLKAAQAQLDQAQAQLASQGNQAGYTSLVADVSGVITAVEAEPGQVVDRRHADRAHRPGRRRATWCSRCPKTRSAPIKPGSEVAVRVWAGGTALAGKVREVAASADPVTRTYSVKVSLDAAAAPALGATVYVSPQALSHAGTPVIKLPTSALRKEGAGHRGLGARQVHHDGAIAAGRRSRPPTATKP